MPIPYPSTDKVMRIYGPSTVISKEVDKTLSEGLTKQFPIESRNYRLEVSNVHAEPKDYDKHAEKDAILKSKSLTYPIRGDLKLYDKHTGKLLDEEKNFPLMDSFFMTDKHTLLYKGNNYSIANQLQLRPGVYTRRRPTDVLETHFNTGTGQSFYITLDPQKQLFNLNIKSSYVPIVPLLTNVFGVGVAEASKYIPKELWEDNINQVKGKENKILASTYSRLVNRSLQKPNPSPEEVVMQLRNALENSELSPQTTSVTLGKGFSHITGESLLLAMKNLADVHSGNREEDNRDSLQFKKIQNLPDFLQTRFKKNQIVKALTSRLGFQLEKLDKENPKIRSVIGPKPFSKFFSDYIIKSNLVSTLNETNPLESVESIGKVTVMGGGEGGISSEDGVPRSARDIDPSHLGIIDPNRTPESSHAGIDQRFTFSAGRDKEGNLYSRALDKKGGKVWLTVGEMMSHVVAFPGQKGQKLVVAQDHGKIKEVPESAVDYWMEDPTHMYTITTNMVPFLNSDHPGRLTMASKAMTQALSLVDREQPLVQTTTGEGVPFAWWVGSIISPTSEVKGVVHKITPNQIQIKADSDGKIHKVDVVKNLPFNMKGFFDYEDPLVSEGSRVLPMQTLVDSNYTKKGVLALGKNLNVAYMPYLGSNHEDGLVISQSCADGLKSHHAYKIDYSVTDTTVMKKSLLNRFFPGKFTKQQLENLDDKGFAKVGAVLHHGDPAYVVMEKRVPTPEDIMFGRLHKTLVNPYRAVVEYWTHDEDGRIVDSHTEGKEIRLLARSIKPIEVGDKLTNLHGGKGIVSLILPDHEMPYSKETGKPADILLNPASVTSRVNLGQLIETGAAKIAQKTGRPYYVHNFSKKSNVEDIKKELEQHGLSDTEEMVDPKTGKSLGKVLTGPQYFLKLFKTSDQNWAARNTGSYDSTMQPTKGGEEGSKSVGYMELLSLLGSNARHNLREIGTIKSEDNADFWAKFRLGQPLPKPKTTFATKKFFDYLKGAGINTKMQDGKITAAPLTNAEVLGMSNGEIKEPLMLTPRGLEPAKNGLFDNSLTGGLMGTKWTHYKLAEPIANPTFERPIRTLLGINKKEYEGVAHGALSVTPLGKGSFELKDTKTGKTLRTLNVQSSATVDPEDDAEELNNLDTEDTLDAEHVI